MIEPEINRGGEHGREKRQGSNLPLVLQLDDHGPCLGP